MRIRNLKIILAAVSILACVFLIALWMRSYWWLDTVICYRGGNWYQVDSAWGALRATVMKNVGVSNGWFHSCKRLEENHFAIFSFGWDGGLQGPVFTAYCSHWLPAILPAIVVAFICRKLRFSLRVLLLATAAIAMMLGFAIYLTH